MNGHPSFRELDRLSLGEVLDDVRSHAESCEACADHLRRLATLPLPPRELRLHAPPRVRRVGYAIAAALAAGIVAFFWLAEREPAPPPKGEWIAAKGAPSVAIFVRRGERTRLWDGASPLRGGDRLRIRVAPEGHAHLLVASREEGGELRTLFAGPVDGAEFLVPGTWEVDAEGEAERIFVGLAPTPAGELSWQTEIVLPKETP